MAAFGYFPSHWLGCGSALTLPTRRYHNNMVYDVIGELFAIDCQDLIQVGCICWCHSGDLYAFGHVMCHMPAMLIGVSPWCHSLMVVIFTSSCWIRYCYIPVGGAVNGMIDGAMRNHVVQLLGVPICRTAAPWWTWWSSVVMLNSTFHDFKLCCGSTWIQL